MHVSSEHDGDRTLHVARLDVPRKLDPHDFGARATLRAVSGLVLAAQSCREDQDSGVRWGRGWLSPTRALRVRRGAPRPRGWAGYLAKSKEKQHTHE